MFAKFAFAALQNSLIMQQIFFTVIAQIHMCILQLLVFDVIKKMAFESNDIEEESAANLILITLPKIKKC